MSISFHINGLVSSHQSVGRWLNFVFCSKDILTKLVGYQQPTCLCVKMEFVVRTISLLCELFFYGNVFVHVCELLSSVHNCVRKKVFRFTRAMLWKLHD